MPKKILIIDDSESDQRLISENFKLENLNYDFVMASSGEEGLEKVVEEKPDIVILDTNLPGINGFVTCQKIKAMEDIITKVIVMTGVIDVVDAGKAREMGADDYCVKTDDCDTLIQAVVELETNL